MRRATASMCRAVAEMAGKEISGYARERDQRRADRLAVEKRATFDVVQAFDPIVVEGKQEWSADTREMWLVAINSEAAQHSWTSSDFVVLKQTLTWFDGLPPGKRGAYAFSVYADVLSSLGLTARGRRKELNLIVEHEHDGDLTSEDRAFLALLDDDDEDEPAG